VRADAAYLRESILDPAARVVEGFEPIMPSFRGRVSEEEVIQLIEYIRSLGAAPEGPAAD
jgi:cytochrome c oxidase subunit 2